MIHALNQNPAPSSMEADVAIIGAGFAGAATAYHLARRGVKRVVVLDKENAPGVHSSGRNAAMVRQVVPRPELAEMGRRGGAAIRAIAKESAQGGFFRQTGSLLFASAERAAKLESDARDALDHNVEVEIWDAATTYEKFPILEKFIAPGIIERACYCPSDGVVDISALLSHYLDAARQVGAQVFLGAGVSEILNTNGKIEGVRFGETEIRTPVVVNAAGGWARPMGDMAGAAPVPLRATRRHLFITNEVEGLPRDLPFVWDLDLEVYFRPEAGGVMMSPCDETHENADLQSDAVHNFAIRLLHTKIRDRFPGFIDVDIARGWSGIRTLTEDGLFMIGPDPKLEGFVWAAGLGGHGLTTSSAVGELVAELILDPDKNEENPHRPGRFSAQRMREIAAVHRI
jgi:D-arginine dehydrogenase